MRSLLLLLAGSLLLPAAKTQNDFDPAADFDRYKTYSFIKGIELEKNGILSDPERRMRLANLVAGALDLRGLKEVPRDQAHDLGVRVWIGIQRKQEDIVIMDPSWSYWGGYPPYWGYPWNYWYDTYVTVDYTQATLIVDLIDTKSKELVWRTYLKERIDGNPEFAVIAAEKDLAKAFQKYPPSESDRKKQASQRAKQKKD